MRPELSPKNRDRVPRDRYTLLSGLFALVIGGAVIGSDLSRAGGASGAPITPAAANASASTEATIDSLYQRGRRALSESRFSESERLLRRVAEARPNDIEVYYWIGVASWNREDAAAAIPAYRRAVELDPEALSPWSLYALENLAEVLTRADQVEASKDAYIQARKRETRPAWIEKIDNQLAELDLTLGIYEPDAATVFNDRGQIIGGVGPGRMRTNQDFEIARHTQDPAKQALYYRRAIDTDPTMYQPYFNLGLALYHLGRYQEAIPWFLRSDQVWKEDPEANPDRIDKADAHAFLARCLIEVGEIDRAAGHAQRALDADPDLFWAQLFAQQVKIAQGRADEALAVLESLAVRNPEQAETQAAWARARAETSSR